MTPPFAHRTLRRFRFAVACAFAVAAAAQDPSALKLTPNLRGALERPLRYHPEGGDFVIRNGGEWFNRPLYGGNTAFRVDAGDMPEFSLYLPGRGGNLRLGVRLPDGGGFWFTEAADITARYRPGMMLYEIRDPRLGHGIVRVQAVALAETEGLALRIEAAALPDGTAFAWAFGGANGVRGARDGDIGTERVPIGQYFQLSPEACRGNRIQISDNLFTLDGATARLHGISPAGSRLTIADARDWASLPSLLASENQRPSTDLPVVIGTAPLTTAAPLYLCIQRLAGAASADSATDLPVYREVSSRGHARPTPPPATALEPAFAAPDFPRVFDHAVSHFDALRSRVAIDTPDPFLNAAVGALNVTADAVWDDPQQDIMHGAIAWRTRLLGWRGPYALDDLGWHDRATSHFTYWAGRQDTSPVPSRIPPADAEANLSRSEAALHSNGDLSHSHYDMNLVYVDALFRHLDWTGDKTLARAMWPVVERHLAWERRLFRRPFGPEQAPLYEAYAAIWASDDLEYDGGGVTHASAYNAYEERRAAALAPLVGADPTPYRAEADAIDAAMHRYLWLPHRGWFAEFRDSLGLRLVHPAAGLWTFYHTVDSGIPTPFEAWQMSRQVDTTLAHLPVRGPGVPADQPYAMVATTDWMPYAWSVNNVVLGEDAHAALAYWQAGRPNQAFRLLKGSLLASMYLGICPGNVGTMTYLDVYRRESQRDFADGAGTLSRAVVEGLFGVRPDLLNGRVTLEPGFPASWTHASLVHPDLSFSYRQTGDTDCYTIESRFARPVAITLDLTAPRENVASLLVDGAPAAWKSVPDAVGAPRLLVELPPSASHTVAVTWSGAPLPHPPPEVTAAVGSLALVSGPGHYTGRWHDPQGVLDGAPRATAGGPAFAVSSKAVAGHRTVFLGVHEGAWTWWQPVSLDVTRPEPAADSFDWTHAPSPRPHYEPVDLTPFFNDRVTQIFRHDYVEPRPRGGASLAIPKQGIGGWAGGVHATADIDDRGLRSESARAGGVVRMPNGLPFATPSMGNARNVAFVSQWSNFSAELTVPLSGRARRIALLMAGSTNWMQSRLDNGEVIVTYTDGTQARLALRNPDNWWPIDQDYFVDDYQFARPGPIPPRIDLKTGRIRLLDPRTFNGQGRTIPGGAATALTLPVDPSKPLASLTLRALSNEVVVGLLSATLERP